MSDTKDDPKTYTLITGASTGLGVEFAKLAARDGRNMILTARSVEKLNKVASDLSAEGVDIIVIPANLADATDAARLWDAATDGRRIDVLVNNAGLGAHGDFSDEGQWKRELNSLNVNVMAFTYLMKQAVVHMKDQGGGRVLNVASVAGFMAGPNMAVYHATKAYALSLSEAVAQELQGSNVTVTALCPGATQTNFHDDADMLDARIFQFSAPMKAFPVAEEGWLEARIGKRVVVPGILNKLLVQSTRLMPRAIVARITGLVMGKA